MTVNLSILSPNLSLVSNNTFPSLMLMNGLAEACPVSCLSNFSLVNILLAVSAACLRSSIGNSIQYNFVGSVFLNTSRICGSPWLRRVATCLIQVTYVSMVSVFSSKLKDLHV